MSNKLEKFIVKVISGEEEFTLSIVDDAGDPIGILRPLNVEHLTQMDVLSSLTDWRNRNMGMFLTQFLATPERTKNWLENFVFCTPGQMMFLIYEGESLIGQVGFKDLTYEDGIIDGGMRGNASSNPKILTYAHKTLIKWLFDKAQIIRLHGWLVADNPGGIMMNKQVGWRDWEKYPLIGKESNNEIVWSVGNKGEASPENKYCYKLTIYKT
ncbi:hypothetical protein G6685_08900 [Polynucleobacter paneuropaeus]|jgi:hypothetical protein|nr:hypothetical protein [Polynucleobacter paneuropaeus]